MNRTERAKQYAKLYKMTRSFPDFLDAVERHMHSVNRDEAHVAWETLDHYIDVYQD